jgi:predicted metal-dependent hydrolase
MEILNFNGISCQVVRRNSRRIRIAFQSGRLRVVLPRHLDPLPIIDQHKKWILEKHEWFQQQQLLAGQLELGLNKRYAQSLAVWPSAISFRKMKSKWGSCSSIGKISLNTCLQALPDELIAFVVFHELAHLKVRNHGLAFKALIRSEFPDYRALDKKLKLFGLKIL